MATLIPSLGSARFDSRGESRLAERLKDFLEDNAYIWHNLPVGARGRHPDFVVVHPAQGILVLEAKDWRIDTLTSATIFGAGGREASAPAVLRERHCGPARRCDAATRRGRSRAGQHVPFLVLPHAAHLRHPRALIEGDTELRRTAGGERRRSQQGRRGRPDPLAASTTQC
jgi:hypothetical protein